jgi:hypothetical protein
MQRGSTMTSTPIRVSRVRVQTLWGVVVAEWLGHPRDLALTLGYAAAISSTRTKTPSIDVAAPDGLEVIPRPSNQPVRLLGRDIWLVVTDMGEIRAAIKNKPVSAAWVLWYLENGFGNRLSEVRAAMEVAAAVIRPEHLNRVGLQTFERFWPASAGRIAKGRLNIDHIIAAAEVEAAAARPPSETGSL